ncbi:MAG: hypothetical protein QNJ34_07505 [Xenococcaceae cyanobacterium MO_188.B29]|nr:hypothetical protein [Xenococcaceae cyanobacterium MO_188.B29]
MLVELIQEVCQHPPQSPQRRKAMNRLLIEIQKLPKLGKSNSPHRLDALNQTFEYVNRNLCTKFDYHQPAVEKRFVQWFNKTFYWRLHDLKYSPKNNKVQFIRLGKAMGEYEDKTLMDFLTQDGFNSPHRDEIDNYIERLAKQEKQNISLTIEKYIIEDPQKILGNCHPRKYPQGNCQLISKKKLLQEPPKKISAIAKELNINYQTLNSHWKRNCLPKLQKIAEDLGYRHE